MTTDPANEGNAPAPSYRWPWFVLGAVILAVVLAVAWMSKEFARARRIRDANAPAPAQTNSPVPAVPVR